MDKIDYLIVRSHIPSIVRWDKEGIILISQQEELNLSILFEKDPTETLCMVEDFIDQCENIKHLIQLKEIKQHLYDEIYE